MKDVLHFKDILSLLIFSFSVLTINAASITVTTLIDEDDGILGGGAGISLREAVNHSLEADTILIPAGEYTLTLEMQLDVEHSLTIIGLDDGVYIQPSETPATVVERIFDVKGTVFNFTVKSVTLRNGFLNQGGHRGAAARIQRFEDNNAGEILFESVTFSDNKLLNSEGAAVYIFGYGGNVRFEQCQFLNNETESEVFNSNGGAICNKCATSLIINRCNFEDNSVKGINAGGGALFSNVSGGSVSISYSSFISNFAYNADNLSRGGALLLEGGDFLITDCTFEGNLSENGGAIYDEDESNVITIINSTIADNVVFSNGGGVTFQNIDGESNLINTIVADNGGLFGASKDIYFESGTLTTNEHNNVETETNASVPNTYTLTGNPELASLAYYENVGYLPLLATSPARDAGIAVLDSFDINTFDLQGTVRASHDIGADEFDHIGLYVTTDQDEDDGILGGGDGLSIREAITYGSAGDTIYIPSGIYDLSAQLVVTKGFVIIGSNPDIMHIKPSVDKEWEETIIQSSVSKWSPIHRIFSVDSPDYGFYLKNITLQNAKNQGSSILMNGGAGQTLSLDYVHIIDNVGNTPIHVSGQIDTFRITNSMFNYNFSLDYSYNNGGVVNDQNSEYLEITNSVFRSNDSNEFGGAIFRDGDSKIMNCSFLGNELDDSPGQVSKGGAIYYKSGDHIIANCTFVENGAVSGGGVHDGYANNTIVMSNCTFHDNFGLLSGRALTTTTSGDKFQIINCLFIDNNNGNISNYGSSPQITNSILSNENLHLDESMSYGEKSIYIGIVEGSSALDGGISELGDYFIPGYDQLGADRDSFPDLGAIEKHYTCSSESLIFQYQSNIFGKIHTADYAVTDTNGWTHYCNAGGNLFLSLDTTNSGANILPSNITFHTSPIRIREDDLPPLSSVLDPDYGGLYSEWMWNVEPEVQPINPVKVRSYMMKNLYESYESKAPDFIYPSDITHIDDINAYVSNAEVPFKKANDGDVEGYSIIAGKSATDSTFVSGSQGNGYYMEYYVPVLNTGGTFTNGNMLRKRWIGIEDEDWHNDNNWSDNSYPTSHHHVTIPDDVPFDPVILDNQIASCRTLRLKCFSNLTLNFQSLLTVYKVSTDGIELENDATLLLKPQSVLNILPVE